MRVVNKRVAGESAYLKKGDVLDLYEKGTAVVRLDHGAILEGGSSAILRQCCLEVAVSVSCCMARIRGRGRDYLKRISKTRLC